MHCLALRKMLLRRSCPSTGHCQSPEWCVALKTTNQWTQVSSLVKCFPFLLPEVTSISLLSLGCPRGLLWSMECDAWSPGPSSPTSILKPNSHLTKSKLSWWGQRTRGEPGPAGWGTTGWERVHRGLWHSKPPSPSHANEATGTHQLSRQNSAKHRWIILLSPAQIATPQNHKMIKWLWLQANNIGVACYTGTDTQYKWKHVSCYLFREKSQWQTMLPCRR